MVPSVRAALPSYVLFILFIGTSLTANAQHLKKEFDYTVSYGYIKDKMHHAIYKNGITLMRDVDSAYQKECFKWKGTKFQNIDFSRFMNCGFNLGSFFRGNTQNFIKSTVHPNHIGTIYAQGAKINLRSPFRINIKAIPRNPNYWTNTLDHKRWLSQVREKPFFKNIDVRYRPYGNASVLDMCMNMPGVWVQGDIDTIKARGEKKIFWFIKAKADVDVKLDLGKMGAYSSEICSAAWLQFKGFDRNQKPIFKRNIYVKPIKFKHLSHRGMKVLDVKVRGANFFTKIALFLAKIFKVKVNDIAKNIIQQQLDQHLNMKVANLKAKLANGSLWKEVFQRATAGTQIRFTKNLTHAITTALKDSSATQPLAIDDTYSYVCEQLAEFTDDPANYNNYVKLCENGLISVKVSAFFKHPTYNKRQCYSRYFHPTGNKNFRLNGKTVKANHWWRNNCRHVSRAHVTIRNTYVDAFNCVRNEMRKKTPIQKIGKICKTKFDKVILPIIAGTP